MFRHHLYWPLSWDRYCRVPTRWGLQQTHPGLRAATRHGARDPLVCPDYLAIITYRKFPNKGAVRPDREEVHPYLKSRDQELSNGI